MPTANTLPPQIEIFAAGKRIDDAGVEHVFSEADVADIARIYNPALREAPLTVGHPASNLPAYGWVKGLGESAGVLMMDTHQVDPQFAEMVRTGRFKKRSSSFYPPNSPNNPTPGHWYLRHVAFLGAQPPAVPGLKDIQFAAGDADAVNFSETVFPSSNLQETRMDEDTKKQLAESQRLLDEARAAQAASDAEAAAAKAQLAQFAEQQRKDRHAAHVSFCEAQVKAGKMLPKDQAPAVAVLDQLADSAPVEFSEGGAHKKVAGVEWLKGLIESAAPRVNFGEFAGAGAGQAAAPLTDAELDQRAQAYAAKHNVSYSEALNRVVAFTD